MMGFLEDSKKMFLENPREHPADLADLPNPETTKSAISAASDRGGPENTKNPELSAETRQRLAKVVRKFVFDCLDFYRDDEAIIERMSEEDLEFAVLEYQSKRDWYRRGLIKDYRQKRY